MYKGFNLKTNFEMKGNDLIIDNEIIEEINNTLKSYSSTKDILDGDMISNDWFKINEADIFISHSHADVNQAKSLAFWLEETFGLKVFIDSMVWGNYQEILKEIDNEYCLNSDKKTYSYEKRNHSTSHMHVMLSMALLNMIDKCEIVIFLNTDNSISPINKTINQTKSPWIYSELVYASLIRRKVPKRFKNLTSVTEGTAIFSKRDLEILRSVDKEIHSLSDLNDSILKEWEKRYTESTGVPALDLLYKIIKERED